MWRVQAKYSTAHQVSRWQRKARWQLLWLHQLWASWQIHQDCCIDHWSSRSRLQEQWYYSHRSHDSSKCPDPCASEANSHYCARRRRYNCQQDSTTCPRYQWLPKQKEALWLSDPQSEWEPKQGLCSCVAAMHWVNACQDYKSLHYYISIEASLYGIDLLKVIKLISCTSDQTVQCWHWRHWRRPSDS